MDKILRFNLIALLLILFLVKADGSVPVGYQEYIVFGREYQSKDFFDYTLDQESCGGTTNNEMVSVVTLTATVDNQKIYYDHWEDGYESDIMNPSQSSTEIYTLNKGDAFWLSSTVQTTVTLNGDTSETTSKVLNSGWNLISFSGSSAESIADVFDGNGQIISVWTYDDGWKAWSPSSYINSLIANTIGAENILSLIKPGKGYWINTQMATNLAIDLTS